MAPNELTIASILRDLANEYDAAVSMREIYERVLERRPTSAKHPHNVIRSRLRTEGPLLGWVSISSQEMMPLHTVLHGLRFRLILDAADIAAGAVNDSALYPFSGALVETPMQFVDAEGGLIAGGFTTYDLSRVVAWSTPTPLPLGGWMRDMGMRPGDSLLATVVSVTPRVIMLEREPAAAFRRAEVKRQDRELADTLAAMTASNSYMTRFPHMSVLPAFAKAAWRTGYPGLPWQRVVEEDRRMHLVDGGMIVNMANNPALFSMYMDDEELDRRDDDLLQLVLAFQQELLAARRQDAARGLWDGVAPRASSAQTMVDFELQSQQILYGGKISALEDHAAAIEESLASAESEDDQDDGALFDDVLGGDLGDLTQIDDVQAFVERNPEIAAATRRLMESLTPEEQRRLDAARTMEDVQQVLGPHLADLLRTEPSLFVPLVAKGDGSLDTNGSNLGEGHLDLDLSILPNPDLLAPDDEWDEDDDDDEGDDGWGEDDDEGDDEDGEWGEDEEIFVDSRQIRRAMNRSKSLMAQFIDHQLRQRKSRQTSESRAADMWLFAEFLSHYYGHSLDMASYATLDEFLFFFYPRKVMNSTQRQVREICTSAKQFYTFLKSEEIIDDDGFAVAIWQRRDQAARVIELFDQVDSDSPQFERLFAHLFAPYTA